jgi:hypothetical protein
LSRIRNVDRGPTGRDLAYLTKLLPGTTLTAVEVVRLASRWWDGTGRKIISKVFNVEEVGGSAKGPGKNGAPAIRVSPNREVVIPSKVLQGHAWDELDRRERAAVVKAWLSQYRKVYAPGAEKKLVLQ